MNRESILIIDDEAGIRNALRSLLEGAGYLILEAVDGLEGIGVSAERHPDLILLDILLPGMDGFEVCARLKMDERLREIPLIFLSGMMDSRDKVKAFRAGAVDYVTKPFHSEEVLARVRAQLELLRQRRCLEIQNRSLKEALDEAGRLNRKLIEVNEHLCRSEALKGHFLANVRNEINNPLNVILGLGLELEAGRVPPERIPAIGGLVAGEASALDFQLENIFCAAELEAGEASPSVARLDLASLMRDALEPLRFPLGRLGVRLSADAQRVEGWPFRSDAAKLRLVLVNLASNAIKFSHPGGEVRVRLRPEGASLVIEVEDDGVGIQPEDQGRIFERFLQLEDGLTRSYPGGGLGLSVVQALVGLLGGTVSVESQPGIGSRFTCSLPSLEGSECLDADATEGNVTFFGRGEGA